MADKISIEDIKKKIEYLTTSQEVWGPSDDKIKADLSLTYMRKKLKEVLDDITNFELYIEDYVKQEIDKIIKNEIPNKIGLATNNINSNIDSKLTIIKDNINILYKNEMLIKKKLDGLLDSELKIEEIKGNI
jgi:hypothetical protein